MERDATGGHNLLLLAQNVGEYIQLGTTIDDAIGEAYDKTARMLGLDLARGGGPAVEELALEGDSRSINFSVSPIYISSTVLRCQKDQYFMQFM
jgi:N6-L-threonylcarbamoyladenine synthase